MALLLILLFLLVLAVIVQRWSRRLVQRRSLPPGPNGWPLLGNLFDIPSDYAWLGYTELAKKHGDIMYMEALGQPILVLSSFRHATDLLDKRSANYSDRPWSRMVSDMMGWKFATAFLPYGGDWRRHRKMMHSHFNAKAVDVFRPIQLISAYTLVRNLLDDPQDMTQHFKFHTGWIILKVAYDYDSKPENDPLIELEDAAITNFNIAMGGGSFLVDFFPMLQHVPPWFPGCGFQSFAAQGKHYTTRMTTEPFNDVRRRMSNKTASPCFAVNLLSELEDNPNTGERQHSEQLIKDVVAFTYAAGADSTVSAISTFILAMIHFPHVQKKAQEMLDAVVGRDRLPTFDDKPDLPYIECILKETIRWYPVTPLGVAHRSIEEDVYDGYTIPAGTIIISNMWAMMQNETDYPNPQIFNPDRFVRESGKELPPDPTNIGFGFGRRICPGRHFAFNTLWITVTSILSAFTIVKDFDENGREIPVEVAYLSGLTVHAKPFRCRFIPRSDKLREILLQSTDTSDT